MLWVRDIVAQVGLVLVSLSVITIGLECLVVYSQVEA